MKKKNYYLSTLLAMLFVSVNLFSLNYTITFTGSGASTSVESVIVQNLTKKTTVTVPLGNVLNLTDVTAINEVNQDNKNLSIFSNGKEGKITITFLLNQTCITHINVFGLDGKKVICSSMNLSQGENSFNLSLPKGIYTIQVLGNGFLYKTKFINEVTSTNKPQITFVESKNPTFQKIQKNISGVTTMLYNTGDQLLYKGISGNYSTIVTDKPILSKTTDFEFIECRDGDGNYYPIVKIGTQIWMAENLKTTKYRDGSPITNLITSSEWLNPSGGGAYCENPNGVAYGKLYNWYTTKDSRYLAPTGWHVSTQTDWNTLVGSNQNNAGGKLKENGFDHWGTPNSGATNESGFTALPGSYRNYSGNVMVDGKYGYWWTTDEYSFPPPYDYAWSSRLYSEDTHLYVYYDFNKITGLSVRCVKD